MSEQNTYLNVEGMDCSSCAMSIERRLKKKGFSNVNVSFSTGEAYFNTDKGHGLKEAIENIEALGYKAHLPDTEAKNDHYRKVKLRFSIALLFTLPLFAHMFVNYHWLHHPLVQLFLCLPVFTIGIIHFGTSAFKSLKALVPNMDVLIFIGSTSAFVYSCIGVSLYYGTELVSNYLFFETSATIITLVLLGNIIELRSVTQTSSSIRELSKLQPKLAKRIKNDGSIEEVESSLIVVGDKLLINNGDLVPTDGKVIKGKATANESMISGESEPVEKSMGDLLIGGTVLLSGPIEMEASAIGDKTILKQIIHLVKGAQLNKPQIQKMGDRVSAVFVPIVLLISLITFLATYFLTNKGLEEAVMSSIAVLVISCPCAMGLATPTAVMVGIGRAAKSGILFKGGDTIETFASIRKFVFDKTGTLTNGEFKIKESWSNIDEAYIHSLLLSMEEKSSHPLAKSIVKELKGKNTSKIELNNIKETEGLGLTATDEHGNNITVGSYKVAKDLTDDDRHNIYILSNNKLLGWFDLEDTIKDQAFETINSLKKSGCETIILSGDKLEKTKAVAQALGINTFYAEQTPSAKLAMIDELSSKEGIAMVGDGINDAPALTKAAVGIALGNATQVAIQSAEVIILDKDDLQKIHLAHKLSKETLKTIKQNLLWALLYNVVAIPIAAFGFLSPMVGALSMAFSDVVVVGNSLRLKIKKI